MELKQKQKTNGTRNRTWRTMLCREVHKQLPHLDYKTIIDTSRRENLDGSVSTHVKALYDKLKDRN